MNNERLWNLPSWVLPSIAMVILTLLWEAAVHAFSIPLFIIPAPSDIFWASIYSGGQIPFHTLITLYETIMGFAVATLIGIGLGIVVVSSRLLRDTFFPLLVVAQSVPKVAIAPVLLITMGYGELPKIIIVFLVCFFPIVVSTAAGLESAPREVLDLARSMSATTLDTFRKVRFPAAMPQVFVGLKVAVILAVIGAIIGEFVGSDRGLGYLILVSMSQANSPLAFGAIGVLAIMSILLFYGVELLERVLVPWSQD
jgi:NitT/TauT family transport system permease protein